MQKEMLTREELMSQLRLQGIEDVSEVKECYLEGEGSIINLLQKLNGLSSTGVAALTNDYLDAQLADGAAVLRALVGAASAFVETKANATVNATKLVIVFMALSIPRVPISAGGQAAGHHKFWQVRPEWVRTKGDAR